MTAGRRLGRISCRGAVIPAWAVVAPGYRPLTRDTMNADDEDQLELEYFFGAGLPDAQVLVMAAVTN